MSFGYGIADRMIDQRNHQELIATLENMNDWQRYARQLEERISKLELNLKESNEMSFNHWFASMTRRALLVASQLWIQKYDEAPVSADLNRVGKNKIENSIETSDESFLSLTQNILKLLVAYESNHRNDNSLYAIYEQYTRQAVIQVLQAETRAEKWKIEKVLEARELSPQDRSIPLLKQMESSNPWSILGPLAKEML